jgi:hypothetical protein
VGYLEKFSRKKDVFLEKGDEISGHDGTIIMHSVASADHGSGHYVSPEERLAYSLHGLGAPVLQG